MQHLIRPSMTGSRVSKAASLQGKFTSKYVLLYMSKRYDNPASFQQALIYR